MPGFFPESTVVSRPPAGREPRCGSCGLLKGCQTPKMPRTGGGRLGVLVVGEAPGADEDERGRQFVGRSGGLLAEAFREAGADLYKDAALTNANRCRPPENKTPSEQQIEDCRPLVVRDIEETDPKAILVLGQAALRSVVGHFLGEAPGAIRAWAGNQVPLQTRNCWVLPTWHPVAILNDDGKNKALKKQLFDHIETAVRLAKKRPWGTVPNWRAEVKTVYDEGRVKNDLERMAIAGGPVSIDFESNAIKPDDQRAAIASCAVCWRGQRTIAYPWTPVTAAATWYLCYAEKVRLIAHNMKHEDRWMRKFGGKSAANWVWCTMNNAHIADNREGTTGLKHLAFTELGFGPYNDRTAGLFESERILTIAEMLRRIHIQDLLEYNGLDALLTYKLAERQARRAGLLRILGIRDELRAA